MSPGNDRRFLIVLLISLLCSFIFTEPGFSGQENAKASPKELLLYELDNNRQLHVTGVVPMDPELIIHQKMDALLGEVSRRYHDGRCLEVLRTEKTKDGYIATINLKEDETDFFKSKWFQAFQGLTADQTFTQLFYDFLQPDYPGIWLSGMNLAWNGKHFNAEAKDALDFGRLTGTTYRREIKKKFL